MSPLISISLPTYNEEGIIAKCLNSIENLDYPKDSLEVFVVDGDSTDKTVKIAKKYSFVKIINNPKKDTHIAKMLGLRASKGKYWTYFDADLQPNGKYWAKAMIKPLEEEQKITASVSRYHGRQGDSWIEKYINLDPIGRDTLFAWFTPSIESTITQKREGYFVCEYKPDSFPPEGRCLFRRKMLMNYISDFKRFRELDTIKILTQNGHNKYAYVPEPGYYHRHPQSLSELRRKRIRNTERNYIPGSKEKYIVHKWFDLKRPRDFFKMSLLVLYSFSIIGPVLGGIFKSIKKKNLAGMVEVIYVPVATEAYLEAFLTNRTGRNIIFDSLRQLINNLRRLD